MVDGYVISPQQADQFRRLFGAATRAGDGSGLRVGQVLSRRTYPQRRRRGGGASSILARITGWVLVSANKWHYAWEQVALDANNADVVVEGGLSGTTTENYAINLREVNNTATGTQGNSIDHSTNYPTTFSLKPFGGGANGVTANQTPVKLTLSVRTDGTTVYTFESENGEQGPCS